jgi:hypothetical protein
MLLVRKHKQEEKSVAKDHHAKASLHLSSIRQ